MPFSFPIEVYFFYYKVHKNIDVNATKMNGNLSLFVFVLESERGRDEVFSLYRCRFVS